MADSRQKSVELSSLETVLLWRVLRESAQHASEVLLKKECLALLKKLGGKP